MTRNIALSFAEIAYKVLLLPSLTHLSRSEVIARDLFPSELIVLFAVVCICGVGVAPTCEIMVLESTVPVGLLYLSIVSVFKLYVYTLPLSEIST